MGLTGYEFTWGFRVMWKILAPSNAIAVGWKVLSDRIQSKANLIRRNISLPSAICSFCSAQVESTNHLFFACSLSWLVWSRILDWIGWLGVLPVLAKDHLIQLFSWASTLKVREGLSVVWLAVIWQIWICRNAKVFRDEDIDSVEIFEGARFKAWLWLKSRRRHFQYSLSEWYSNPVACLEVI